MLPALIMGGALVGSYLANKSASDRAADLQDQAFREFVNVAIPDPQAQRVALERYVLQGELVPELQQAIKQNPSEFEKIVVIQSQKAAQNRALRQLEQAGFEGGLGLQDKAALQEATLRNQMKDRAERGAILDEASRRGQLGSGTMLQAQLQGQQASGDRAATSALSVAAAARERALRAIEGAGNLATNYRTQDFQEQAAKARAQDEINAFNARNLQSVMNANVAAKNRAQEMNLANRQDVANRNVGVSNQEQQYNKEIPQRNFENQMNLARSKAGIYSNKGNIAMEQGKNMSNTIGNIGQGALGMYAAGQSGKYDSDYEDYLKKKKSGEV